MSERVTRSVFVTLRDLVRRHPHVRRQVPGAPALHQEPLVYEEAHLSTRSYK